RLMRFMETFLQFDNVFVGGHGTEADADRAVTVFTRQADRFDDVACLLVLGRTGARSGDDDAFLLQGADQSLPARTFDGDRKDVRRGAGWADDVNIFVA